jgi:hypothetical protein
MIFFEIEIKNFPFFCHITDSEIVLEMCYLVNNAIPGIAAEQSAAKQVGRGFCAYPALLTMMWILPFPNSAVFFTRVFRYSASSISPGTAIAFPPDLLMFSATCFAFSAWWSVSGFAMMMVCRTCIDI